MKQEQVTLCVFHDYAQAREAANRLNEAGIPTHFSGEAASTAGGGFAPAVVTIRLEVPECFLDRACDVLNAEAEQAGAQEELAEGIPGEGPDNEDDKDEEAAPGPLKEVARFVVGPILDKLDKPFALLESTRPPERPGEETPYNIWGPVIVVGFVVLILLKMMLRFL
jgi:hypothetical protein